MYVNEKIEIKINSSNIKFYITKYQNIKVHDKITINISELSKGSHNFIEVCCDECGIIKKLQNKNYHNYGYSDGNYLCKKCKTIKSNQEKYGVNSVLQLNSVQEKINNTIKEKYGVDNISQSKEIQKRIKENNINKYGTEHHMQNDEILEKQKKTNLEKYGCDNVSKNENIKNKIKQKLQNRTKEEIKSTLEKTKKTNLQKYNFEFYTQTEEYKIKTKKTSMEKYGVEHWSKIVTIKNSKIKKSIEKYGTEYSFQNEKMKDRIKNTNLIKYGYESASKSEDIIQKIRMSNKLTAQKKLKSNDANILDIKDNIICANCDLCNNTYYISRTLYNSRKRNHTILCTKCNIIGTEMSGKEIQLVNFIKEFYNNEIIISDRKILNGKELDIYLPDSKIAFEFNGLYWHSELYKEKNYHLNKTKKCLEKGIQLIHVWEDDWDFNKQIIESIILNKLGKTPNKIMARKCEIREISNNELIRNFLNNNHIQGFVGSSIKIGLFYNNELISLMTFKNTNNVYELNRFCTKINTNVIGGASKLFKYFIKNYKYEKIISFSNNDYSDGGLYKKLGFTKIKDVRTDYSYLLKNKRFHKFNFRKKSLSKIFDINIKTEHEICLENNIFKIYDSGKIKWVY